MSPFYKLTQGDWIISVLIKSICHLINKVLLHTNILTFLLMLSVGYVVDDVLYYQWMNAHAVSAFNNK